MIVSTNKVWRRVWYRVPDCHIRDPDWAHLVETLAQVQGRVQIGIPARPRSFEEING